ncbi:MAG: hypothetical protein COW71_12120 [Ignavibacteriales bacterium CG18_big_fil_WC_8_21_14_2_50_31_20]|nr:MAG: hypothetical protein COW71_12120 [Ignavibacteriales bacterium CG18_big_fil_WC_8_21_14_2_50_31_20]
MNNYLKYLGLVLFAINSNLISQNIIINSSVTESPLEITIASEPDYPPYCIVDENGNADGFSIDLIKAATKAVGIKLNIKIGVWNEIKNDLAIGKIDALPLVGRTPERESLYDFTLPYLSLHGAIFVKEGTLDIDSLEDLKGKTISVMKGDNAEEFILRENISKTVISTHTFEEAFHMLENGESDAVITQRIMGIKLLENMGIKTIKPLDIHIPQFRQDFCFAVQKGNRELLTKLNEGLSIIIANNTFNEIQLKWFGTTSKRELDIKDILWMSVYIFIPLFIIMLVISIFLLNRKVRQKTKYLENEILEHNKTFNDLKLQKDLLSHSEQQIRLLLNSTAEGIYGIDQKGNCTFCNRSALNLLGYADINSVIGKNMHQLIHHSHANKSKYLEEDCKIYIAFRKGKEIHVSNEVLWKADGTYFDAEYFSYPIKQDGKSIGAVITFWDITKDKIIKDELKKTKEYLENLINYAQAPIIVWDTELNIERFNRAFERLTGLKFDEVIGKNIDIIFPGNSREESIRLINSLKIDSRSETIEIEIKNIDGSIKNVLWNSAKIYDSDNNLIATIAQGNDITERKVAENELKKIKDNLEIEVQKQTAELNEKLKKLDKSQRAMLYMIEDLNEVTSELKNERRKLELSNKELEAFSYSVSHDLRAPLRAIDGFSKFLEEDFSNKLDDEGKRLLKVIRENAKKMDRLIADMLNLSRLSRIEINYTKIDMEKMVESIYNEIANDNDKNTFEFNVETLPKVNGDSTLIEQVWTNLIGNAIKYSQKSQIKKIVISAEDKEEYIEYKIQDFGAGFNEKYVSKLFGVFQRLHTEIEFEGTGVGLAIVKRIIHRHGGEVWAKGEINKGATFYFSLPKKN